MTTVFEFLDYRRYLLKFIHEQPRAGHGFRAKMAGHLDCKTSFISQVLGGDANFSVEQAFALISLLQLGAVEGKYFLALVQMARAGRKDLRDYFKKEAESLKTEALRLKNRIAEKSLRSKEDEFKYFSSAEYGYLHILTTIPEYQTRDALLKKSKLTVERFDQVLSYLLDLGYVAYDKGRFVPGPMRLHVADDAAIIATHHTNWRIQAIKACQSAETRDFHYSSVISISREDFDSLRAKMVRHIEEYRKVINDSGCEAPYSLCLDFYELR